MKKIGSFCLALALVFGIATTALAGPGEGNVVAPNGSSTAIQYGPGEGN